MSRQMKWRQHMNIRFRDRYHVLLYSFRYMLYVERANPVVYLDMTIVREDVGFYHSSREDYQVRRQPVFYGGLARDSYPDLIDKDYEEFSKLQLEKNTKEEFKRIAQEWCKDQLTIQKCLNATRADHILEHLIDGVDKDWTIEPSIEDW